MWEMFGRCSAGDSAGKCECGQSLTKAGFTQPMQDCCMFVSIN